MSLTQAVGSNYSIDITKLDGADFVPLMKFMLENGKEIGQRLNNDTRAYLLRGYVPGHEPSFVDYPDFIVKGFGRWYPFLRNRFCITDPKGSVVNNLLPIVTYLYDCYGVSPSKMILGCEVPTKLPSWLQTWLKYVDQLSNEDTAKLYEILHESPPVRCDAIYVLKSRIQEMAGERGVRSDEFFTYPGMLTMDRLVIREFTDAKLTETENSYEVSRSLMGNHKILRLIVAMCAIYQVSPEYLILQDYSDFAVTEQGRYYPPAQRKLLSTLLQASAATRAKAIGFVYAAAVRGIVASGELPLPSMRKNAEADGEEGPVNVMAAFSAAAGTQTLASFDASFIETLKPKVLAIIESSEEPVSGARLYQIVEGPPRLVRRTLNLLASEGVIERVPMGRDPNAWQMAKTQRGRRKSVK